MLHPITRRAWILRNPGLLGLTLFWKIRGYGTMVAAGQRMKFKRPYGYGTVHGLREGRRESHAINCLREVTHQGDIFFDVGAHVGLYTLLAARFVGPSGRVFAFEPDSEARNLLEENIALNKVTNAMVFPYAISDRSGPVRLLSPRSHRSQSSIGSMPAAGQHLSSQEVRATSLDDFCAEYGIQPDVVKIDIEGAEALALTGGKKVLSQARVVLLELHPIKVRRDFGGNLDDYWRDVFQLGKAVYQPAAYASGPWGPEVTEADNSTDKVTRWLLVDRSTMREVLSQPR